MQSESLAKLELLIGRELYESEVATISWIQCWEKEHIDNIMRLVERANTFGFSEGKQQNIWVRQEIRTAERVEDL